MTLVYHAGMPLPLLLVTMQGVKLTPRLKLNPKGGGVSALLAGRGDSNLAPMRTPIGTGCTPPPMRRGLDPAPLAPRVLCCWGGGGPLATVQILAREAAVLAVTCEFL